ncbi:MAG: TonB-dependent receptor [Prevotella sp.]|nr:TonB-dependent receptor [Prevotella sp.]
MKDAMRLLCKLCLLAAFFVLAPPELMAQTTVKGQVFDSTGEPVIGATVVEKGNAKNAAVTDYDGNFTMKVPAGKKVVITYMGMKQQEVTPTDGMKVTMEDDNAALEEVVVVGYTSKARKDLTGSVGSISGMKLAAVPVASAGEALQGKIAGVQVSTVDGAPGADITIKIRGGSALGQNNQPLYIVDGFQADNINDIPPTDIQSIDVLKDASLTAIYGARGGNGVVIVTTKSAQQGSLKVEFNAYAQASKLAGKQDMLDSYEFALYQHDYVVAASYGRNNGRDQTFRYNWGNPSDLDIYRSATTHDWQDELMGGTPITQMYNATVSGGNDKLRFSTSLTQHNQNGVIDGTGVYRTNMNTKIVAQLSPRLKLTINPRFTYRKDEGASGNGMGREGLLGIVRWKPVNGIREFTQSPYVFDDNAEDDWRLVSPMDDINQHYQNKHTYTFINQGSLSWEIIDNLTFRTDFAQSWAFSDENKYYGSLTDEAAGTSFNHMPYATIGQTKRSKYTWTNTLNYNLTLKDVHNFSFLLGHEMQHDQRTTTTQGSRYFSDAFDLDPQKTFNDMGQGTAYLSTSSKSTPSRMLSFFGQANYNYDHKYLLSLTMRADGSTKFAPGHQWGYFPSISGAWVISQEPFMKDVKWLSNLKLRAAFGLAGNNDIGDDRWRYVYTTNSTGGPSWNEATIDGTTYYSTSNTFPNEEIKWETTVTRNAAIDIGLFKDRLTITPEFYWNTTRDLLYTSYIPTTSGFGQQTRNVGQVTNKGVELTVNYQIIQKKDFDLSANLTMGYNKSKVDKLNGDDKILWTNSSNGKGISGWKSDYDDFCLRVGEEVGLIYGFIYDGLYSFDEFNRTTSYGYEAKDGTINCDAIYGTHPGLPKFKDISGPEGTPDGIVDEYDRTVIGNTNPRLQGGFGFSGNYKNFDFNANFVYFLNYDVLNATSYILSSRYGASESNPKNVLAKFDYANRWGFYGDTYQTDADGNRVLYYMNEALLGDSQHPEYIEQYEQMNAGKTLWNPQSIGKRITHSYFVEDASFLRLQNITVGYTLPKQLTKNWGISRLRVYFTGSNLFCITNYSGYDPEVDIQGGLAPSVDYNRYPRSRSYLLGVNLSF